MIATIPRPPLGKYPQLRLCGHVGAEPIAATTRTINKMVSMSGRWPSEPLSTIGPSPGKWGQQRRADGKA
jgi:hypothetical protein